MEACMGDFQVKECLLDYSSFVPRFYNLCRSYGFKPGKIMPSRAFCSDENQGGAILLIAAHFGAFPFDHGMVGGIVATDRHGPHAHHGRDLALIQASHVGYDPETKAFGTFRRQQMEGAAITSSCGKIDGVLDRYFRAYAFAGENIRLIRTDGRELVLIDNQFLETGQDQGLFLHLDRLIATAGDQLALPVEMLSTAKAFPINPALREKLPPDVWQSDISTPIGRRLTPDLFYFERALSDTLEGRDQLEKNLAPHLPHIVTAPHPLLSAAMANTRIEFDRTFRTLIREPAYQGKNLAFIAGLNIDISPREGERFSRTLFVPWSAYIRTRDGKGRILEQDELAGALMEMEQENPDRIELAGALQEMENRPLVTPLL